jgi:hypothetical protein
MPNTPNYQLPYPLETDSADVPRDIQALAVKIDGVLPNVGFPTGGGLDWYATTPPAGFLLCDGSAISRTSFSALFGVLGTTWGAGDGTSTFNLPDTRGRVIVGYAPGGHADVASIAANDGAALASRRPRHGHTNGVTAGHNLSLPAHGHGVSDPGHGHGVNDPGHSHNFNASWHADGPNSGRLFPDTAGPAQGGLVIASGTGISVQAAGTGVGVGNPTSYPGITGGVQISGSIGVTGPVDSPSYVVAAKAVKT